jgi:hypothetical protein
VVVFNFTTSPSPTVKAPFTVATTSRPVERVVTAPAGSWVAKAPDCAVTDTKFRDPYPVLWNTSPEAGAALFRSAACTPVESLIRFTAKAMADAVVPLVKVSTSTPSVPEISSVTVLATLLPVNASSAVRALVITFTSTGIMSAVPKLAWAMSRAVMSAVLTPLVM